jgi:RND family efflux transporter MFP subunit
MKLALRILLPVIAFAAFAGPAYMMVKNRKPPERRPPPTPQTVVAVEALVQEDFQVVLESQGTVRARLETSLLPQVSGRVISVARNFRDGGFFEQGDVLLTIDPRDYDNAIAKAKAGVAQAEQEVAEQAVLKQRAKAEVTIAQAELKQAQLGFDEEEARSAQALEDWKRLKVKGDPSDLVLRKPQLAAAQSSVDAAQARLKQRQLDGELAGTRIEAAKAKSDAARADLAQRELDHERTTIKAPYAGRILERRVDINQFVTAGNVLATIYAVDYAEIRLPLSRQQLGFIILPEVHRGGSNQAAGPAVTILVEHGDKRFEWQAQVVRTEGAVDQRTRQLFVIAHVDDPYGEQEGGRPSLKVGQFVRARIDGVVIPDVISVPRSALRNGNELLVVDTDSKLRRRTVEFAYADKLVAVVSNGVEAGERICITPVPIAVDGMPVVVEGEAPPRGGGDKGRPGKRQ